MRRDRPDSSSSSASQAMNTVLKAEQDAEQDIAECLKMARKRVDEAQQQAARIARRTNKRITLSHLRSKQAIAHCVAELERVSAHELQQAEAIGIDEDTLSAAADEVAALLIGVGSGGKPDS